jgi:hypothetical protein
MRAGPRPNLGAGNHPDRRLDAGLASQIDHRARTNSGERRRRSARSRRGAASRRAHKKSRLNMEPDRGRMRPFPLRNIRGDGCHGRGGSRLGTQGVSVTPGIGLGHRDKVHQAEGDREERQQDGQRGHARASDETRCGTHHCWQLLRYRTRSRGQVKTGQAVPCMLGLRPRVVPRSRNTPTAAPALRSTVRGRGATALRGSPIVSPTGWSVAQSESGRPAHSTPPS